MREDWIETEIISVANLYQPKTISSKMLVENGKYAVYGANGVIGCYHKYNHEEAEFLITCRGATCGNVHITKPYSWINGNAMVVQPFKKQLLSLDYLKYVFTNKGRVQKAISGSAQPQITRTTLSPIRIPLAPLPEQRAIVAKIEELFSELDKGEEDLKKAQEQLKIYRQAVLNKAFEAEVIRKSPKQKLSSVTDKIGSGSTPRGGRNSYKSEGIPLVRSLNIHFDYIKYDGLAFIDEEQASKLKNVVINEGDVLLNITGASIGRVNIAPAEFDGGRVNQHVSIIRANSSVLLPLFLKFYIQSPLIQDWISNENYGVTRQALTKSAQENIEIPILSIHEQGLIINEIESRLSVCDNVEASICESLDKSKALRQSILKKAFEGTLLSEEEIAACKAASDYEPASVLLERIKAEKKKN